MHPNDLVQAFVIENRRRVFGGKGNGFVRMDTRHDRKLDGMNASKVGGFQLIETAGGNLEMLRCPFFFYYAKLIGVALCNSAYGRMM